MSPRSLINIILIVVAGLIFLLYPEQKDRLGGDILAAPEETESDFDPFAAGRFGGIETLPSEDVEEADGEWPGIRGRVVDLRGEPVGNLTVRHLSSQAGQTRSTHSNPDGHFELMVDDSEGELSIKSTRWVLLEDVRRRRGSTSSDAVVIVAPAVAVAGRVVDEAGEIVPEADVIIDVTYPLPSTLQLITQRLEVRFEHRTQASATGRFDLGRLPRVPGLQITVEHADHERVFEPVPGADTTSLTIIAPRL